VTKRKNIPQYLTTNQAGTYVFQVRIPRHIWQNNPGIKRTLWRSLGTKNHGEALRLSKRMWLMFDELSNKFNDSEVFGKAMELLREYDTKAIGDWSTAVEPFLMGLGDENNELLERVLACRSEIQQQRNVEASTVTAEDLKKAIYEAVSQATNKGPDFSKENHLLSDMVDQYMDEHINDALAPGSRKPYRSKLQQFNMILQACNDGRPIKLSDIDEVKMRKYADIMGMFPADYSNQKVFKGMSITDVVGFVQSHKNRDELQSKGIQLLTDKKEPLRLARSLLAFIERKKYPLRPGLQSVIQYVGGKKKGGATKKNAMYRKDELKALFESERYKHAKFNNAVDYWAPLIAVHTGATLAEICQLHVSDIKNEDGTDLIDINDEGDFKRLKNDDGRPRQVPIHPTLNDLGFLKFVESRKGKGFDRLFPEAERNEEDKYDSTGKRYATYRKKCGVTGAPREKTFHSFRSTVSYQLLKVIGCDEGLVNDIVGHASDYRESETKKTYGTGRTMAHITNKWVKKLDYGIDFDYPKRWRD
jgi:integrase